MNNENITNLLHRLSEVDSAFCRHIVNLNGNEYDRFVFSDGFWIYECSVNEYLSDIQTLLLKEITKRGWWINISNPGYWMVRLANSEETVSEGYLYPCLTIALLESFVNLVEKLSEVKS